MRISLDYDDTYTKDPEFWDEFIHNCRASGYEIMIVTFRDPSIPIEIYPEGVNVYYTSYRAKRRFMLDEGIEIDVWIDDSPECIVSDSSWSYEERERWKNENLSHRKPSQ